MFLTAQTKYAVVAMLELAMQEANGSALPVRLVDISKAQNVKLSYLEQIFNKLKRKTLVIPVRGPGGGYKLAKSSNEIYISEIIDGVSEKIKIRRCSGKSVGCVKKNALCIAHHLWTNLEHNIEDYFKSLTLKDVLLDYGNNAK